MNSKWLFFLWILLFSSLQAEIIQELNSHKTTNLKDLLSGPSIWIFFKLDCPVCAGVASRLNCPIDKKKIFWVGFGSPKHDLWRESKKLQLKKHGFEQIYYADQVVLEHFHVVRAESPQLIFMKDSLQVRTHLGSIPCEIASEFLSPKS